MPPASRIPHRVTSFRCFLLGALLCSATIGAEAVETVGAGAATLPKQFGPPSSLQLAGQTSWVRGRSGLELQLRIATSLPVTSLELKFVLYSRLTTRSAFALSLSGNEPTSELPIDTPPAIALRALDHRDTPNGSVTVKFPVDTETVPTGHSLTSPTLNLNCGDQCDGVYPFEAALVNSRNDELLASLTTHLIYTASATGPLPLDVAIVLPSGTTPALTNTDVPAITAGRLVTLRQLLSVLGSHSQVPITVDLYPQLLLALERDKSRVARSVLLELDAQLKRSPTNAAADGREVLGTTFTAVDVVALAGTGLGGEIGPQLTRGIQILDEGLHRNLQATPYVVDEPLDRRTLSLLVQAGVRQIVVPASNVTTLPGSPAPSEVLTSPFVLDTASPKASASTPVTGPVAFAADANLAAHFGADPGDPVLAAHQLLADLAEIYFNAPYSEDKRGVVVAPATWAPNDAFIAAVLAGLADSPILRAVTLGRAFQLTVGGNATPEAETLATGNTGTTSLDSAAAVNARTAVGVVRSLVPTDTALLSRLSDALLMAETLDLARSTRVAFDAAPNAAIAAIRTQLSFIGGTKVTLTSLRGQKIPVTVVSSSRYPIHARVELRDNDLEVTGTPAANDVTLAARTWSQNFPVTVYRSGRTTLQVVLVSPLDDVEVVSEKITIDTTAVSDVAVAISIGALIVLAAWWLRSVRRHRRAKMLARTAALSGASG